MKPGRRVAAVAAAAASTIVVSAGGAHAQTGTGSLLGLINLPVVVGCFPTGQAGCGNSSGGGVTGAHTVLGDFTSVAAGQSGVATVFCPAGQVATGGGFDTFVPGGGSPDGFLVVASEPVTVVGSQTPTAWEVNAVNNSPSTVQFRASATCVDAAR
ncbi:hypothetical protein GCM10010440_06300 [Kitasatospora cinereorecta]